MSTTPKPSEPDTAVEYEDEEEALANKIRKPSESSPDVAVEDEDGEEAEAKKYEATSREYDEDEEEVVAHNIAFRHSHESTETIAAALKGLSSKRPSSGAEFI